MKSVELSQGPYLRSANKGDMVAAVDGLRTFERPALVVWATEIASCRRNTAADWPRFCPGRA